MVNEDLLNYIRTQQAHGFKQKEIEAFLKKNGYSSVQIKESFTYLHSKKSFKPLYFVIALVFLLILIAGVLFATWKYSQPVCGNGIIEEGETRETCCVDTGCLGDQTCEANACQEVECGTCQYERNNVCYDYDCCDDSACMDGESCQNNRCREISCGYCQYQDDHQCLSYYCCEDEVCNDFDSTTSDRCEHPGTLDATCVNKPLDIVCIVNSDCDDGNNMTLETCENPATVSSKCTYEDIVFECEVHEDCNDNKTSTADYCDLNRQCANPLIVNCKNDDGFCPITCFNDTDNDCDGNKSRNQFFYFE